MDNKLGRKKLCSWELAKTKANLKPESNLKVWNTFKNELGGMKPVNAMKIF